MPRLFRDDDVEGDDEMQTAEQKVLDTLALSACLFCVATFKIGKMHGP